MESMYENGNQPVYAIFTILDITLKLKGA